MRKKTPLALAFLVAEALMSCSTDQNSNDGINEDAAGESIHRNDQGEGADWEHQGNDTAAGREHDVPERLSTEGEDGK